MMIADNSFIDARGASGGYGLLCLLIYTKSISFPRGDWLYAAGWGQKDRGWIAFALAFKGVLW